jgi:hypothetical protein|tara:strand:+ start:4284 stop:6503 length:2220 start_codon:yes stop_codon:yes gene_type:complete
MATCLSGSLTHVPSGARLALGQRLGGHARSRWKKHPHQHRPVATRRASGDDKADTESSGVLDVLAGCAGARCPGGVASTTDTNESSVVRLEGTGTHLGMKSTWRLAFSTNNSLAFEDEVVLVSDSVPGAGDAPLESHSGFDPNGGPNCQGGTAWAEALGGGIVRHEFCGADGEHRGTLVSWIRTGQWLDERARGKLNVKLLRGNLPLDVLVQEHSMVPTMETSQTVETTRVVVGEGTNYEDDDAGDDATRKPGRRRKNKREKGRDRDEAKQTDKTSLGGLFSGVFTSDTSSQSNATAVPKICRTPPPPPVPKSNGALLAVAARGGRIGARVWLRRLGASDDVGSFKKAFLDTVDTGVDRRDLDTAKRDSFEANLGSKWWVVHRLEIALPEGVETWVFDHYGVDPKSNLATARVAHQTMPGGDACLFSQTNQTKVLMLSKDNGNTSRDGSVGGVTDIADFSPFALPTEGYVDDPRWEPPRFETSSSTPSATTTAGRGDGGHALVRVALDGTDSPGWFALDTGSGGNAICGAYADSLGLPEFGKLTVVGAAAAALSGCFRRATSLSIGAVTVQHPLFMEQALSGAMRCPVLANSVTAGGGSQSPGNDSAESPASDPVTGGGQLVGTLGTDVMQHCVVEIKAPRRKPGSPRPATFEVNVYDPAKYEKEIMTDRVDGAWQRVTWIQGQPHVRCKVLVADDSLTPGPPVEARASPNEPKRFVAPQNTKRDAPDATEEWSGRLFR